MEYTQTYDKENKVNGVEFAAIFTKALSGDLGQQLIDRAIETMIQRLNDLEASQHEELRQQTMLQERLTRGLDALADEDLAEHWRLIEEVQTIKGELNSALEERTRADRQLRESLAQCSATAARSDAIAERAAVAEQALAAIRSEQETLRRRVVDFEDRLVVCEELKLTYKDALEKLQQENDKLTHRLAEFQASWARLSS